MPLKYKALRDTILDCNKHFEAVIKDSQATFTSEQARRAIDNWIELVIEASMEIRKTYSKTKTGAYTIFK